MVVEDGPHGPGRSRPMEELLGLLDLSTGLRGAMIPTQAWLSATILTLTMAAQAHSPGSISGFVNDSTGKPIEGVMVVISERDLKDLIRLRTGADGAFITSNLVEGRYLIEFKHPGYSMAHRKAVS